MSEVMFCWQSAQETHQGNRRKNNEDSVLSRPDVGLWAVADGMGGHMAGDVASQAITDSLRRLSLEGSLADVVDRIEDALVSVNDELRLHARVECQGGTVGSTVVVLVVRDNVGVALWAGDSRLYRQRGGRLEQITRDHNPICDLLDTGGVSEAEALEADTNIITRAVGGQPELNLDVVVFDVANNDTFLLCTDGLYREIDRESLAAQIAAVKPEEAVNTLMSQCLAGAARDNVSVVVTRAL